MSADPDILEAMDEVFERRFAAIETAIPGRIVKYDAAAQIADVLPLVKRSYLDEDGARVVEQLPVIPHVPVIFPGSSSTGARLTLPMAVGDTVKLLVSSASLDVWLSRAEPADPVDPQDDRRFHVTDAVALPWPRRGKTGLTSAPTDRITLGYDGGMAANITPDDIRLGANDPADLNAAACAEKVNAKIQEVLDFLAGAAGSDFFPLHSIASPNTGGSAVRIKK